MGNTGQGSENLKTLRSWTTHTRTKTPLRWWAMGDIQWDIVKLIRNIREKLLAT